MDFEDEAIQRAIASTDTSDAFKNYVAPDTLPTVFPSLRQRECAAKGHGWRDGCHCDGGGSVCRRCGFHEHYAPAQAAQ